MKNTLKLHLLLFLNFICLLFNFLYKTKKKKTKETKNEENKKD